MLPLWMLLALVSVTVAIPILYVAITWEHDVVCSYPALPAPSDLGTKEFRWRCFLSAMTRNGWRTSILRSPCPRITLQSRFALLSTDFAKMTTSLGFQELKLETIPFIFPQVAVSGLMLQLLGNSNFPAALDGVKIKAITICQLRALDMRFRDKLPEKETEKETETNEAEQEPGLHCLMVLTEKRFLEDEIEFAIQTDLFDEQGTVWQSTTLISVPFKQPAQLVPISVSAAQLDATLAARQYDKPESLEFMCMPRNVEELEEVSVTNLDGRNSNPKTTPLMWIVGRTLAALQQQKRTPALPLLCTLVVDENVATVPLQGRVHCESSISQGQDKDQKPVTKVEVKYGKEPVMTGLLRTVGWVFEQDAEQS